MKTLRSASLRDLLLSVGVAIAGLVAVSVLLYGAGLAVLRHSEFRFSRIARGAVHVDVLIVGNSRARDLVVGRSPDATPSAYNLAYNGLNRGETLAWAREFFRRGNTAHTVVIEITALYLDQVMCDGKAYWALYPALRELQAPACGIDAAAARVFPLTLFNSEQFMRALYYLRHSDQGWGDGYTIPPSRCAHMSYRGVLQFGEQARAVDVAALRAQLQSFRDWLASNAPGTHLVFVLAPFLAGTGTADAVADIERANQQITAGAPYVSLAHLLDGRCEAFADEVHVGPHGRESVENALFAALSDSTHP